MTLLELFSLLRKHLVLVIVLPIVTAALVFAVVMLMPNQYTASTTMYVLTRSEGMDNTSPAVTQSDFNISQMITSDVATLVKSDRIQDDVAQLLGLEDLKKFKLQVTTSTTTRVLTLSVTNTDPEMAANVANAIVEDVSSVAQDIMQVQSVNVIDAATAPTEPSGPRRLLFTAVGAMAGFMLAVVIVVLHEMLDTRVNSSEEIEAIVGVPVIGHFPVTDA